MKQFVRAFSVSCVALAVAGCATIVGKAIGVSVTKGERFPIIYQEEKLGWGHYDHPFLYSFPDCVAVLFNKGGETTGYGVLASKDQGKTWFDIAPKEAARNQGWFSLLTDGGTNCLALKRTGDIGGIYYADLLQYEGCSESIGLSLTKIRTISLEIATNEVYKQFVELGARGTIDRDGYAYIDGFFVDHKNYTGVACFRLAPGDDVLRRVSYIARKSDAPWGFEGPNEAAIQALPNGELVAVMRTGAGSSGDGLSSADNMLLARSTDKGLTWTRRMLGAPGVRPKLILMSNGVLACAFGRPGNNLMLSTDGGRSWPLEFEMSPIDESTGGYADIAEVAPGRLLFAYDVLSTSLSKIWLWEPPHPVNGVFARYVDVKRSR